MRCPGHKGQLRQVDVAHRVAIDVDVAVPVAIARTHAATRVHTSEQSGNVTVEEVGVLCAIRTSKST